MKDSGSKEDIAETEVISEFKNVGLSVQEKQRRLNQYWSNINTDYIEERVASVDREDIVDPQCVAEYAEECCKEMLKTEKEVTAQYGYMNTRQNDINEKMRAILVDWLIEVHYKFKLMPETLFLTVNLIDRYLEQCEVLRTKL